MAAIALEPLPPEEAVAFFRAKGLRPSFAWQDVWQEEHAAAFTVAKAMRLDVLQDIRDAMDAAIADGTTFADFKKNLTPILQEKGWWGRQVMTDPLTGETKLVQLGSTRRLRTIFDTNINTSYAAGRWAQIQRVKQRRPFLRYVHADGVRHPRPLHLLWHGTILPVDDPWWRTHYPPNGWFCHCSVQQLGPRDLEREGWRISDGPPGPQQTRTYVNPRTGATVEVPIGIDPGFGYNPGIAAEMLRSSPSGQAARLLAEKAGTAMPELGAAALAGDGAAQRALAEEFRVWFDAVREGGERRVEAMRAMGNRFTAGVLDDDVIAYLAARRRPAEAGAITVEAQQIGHALRDAKVAADKAVPPEVLRELPRVLAAPDAVLEDLDTGNLVYVVRLPGEPRLAAIFVRPGATAKAPKPGGGRRTVTVNDFVTATLLERRVFSNASRFRPIKGEV